MKKIGLIFALEEELNAFKKKINILKESSFFELKFYEGQVSNITCILVQCGVGKVNAARTTQILIDNFSIDYIFNIGVAGATNNNLSLGDIILAEKLVQHDFDITAFNHEQGYIPSVGTYIKTNPYLLEVAREVLTNSNLNFHVGTIASGDTFCTSLALSKKISHNFKALCIEMEGASIAQVCFLCQIPFLVIRSISDVIGNSNTLVYEKFLEKNCEIIASVMLKIINYLQEQ